MRVLRLGLLGLVVVFTVQCGSDDSGGATGGGGDGGIDGTFGDGASPPPADAGGGKDATTPNDSSVPNGDSGNDAGPPIGASVLQHHNHATRDGVYVQPTLTKAAVATMKLDTSFNATFQGDVYGQALYVENGPGGKGAFFVATEADVVYALDETTGAQVWKRTIGAPAGSTGAGCGNIGPLGITGTPYIDLATRTMFLDAVIATGTGGTIKTHEIHALSIDDGTERTGFPVDVSKVKDQSGNAFNPVWQNQRGALIGVNGVVYVPYGGHSGDCPSGKPSYRGWVVGVPMTNPAGVKAFATTTYHAGIWMSGGLASDGTSIYAATGNGDGGNTWNGSDAILRLSAGPVFSNQTTDYFAPADWSPLDNGDVDLGTGPLLVDLPGAASPLALAISLGKDGKAYLADRTNLGGVGKELASKQIANAELIGAPAVYTTAGGTFLTARVNETGMATGCPQGQSGNLLGMKIAPGSPPAMSVVWCRNAGSGSPSVTTTDGTTNAVVWVHGEGSDDKLHAWDAETGTPLFTSTETMNGLRHWTVPIAVKGRVLIAADNQLYAFKTP